MAGKNRVGSLYMELVLDPSKYAKGASQAVKDHRRMQKELSKAHNGMDPKTKAAADLDAAKKAAIRMVKLKKMTFNEGKAIIRAATANYNAELKKVETAEATSQRRRIKRIRAWQAKRVAASEAANREIERENSRLDKKYQAYLAHRHAVQRRWNKRHTRLVAEEARKQAALRRSAFGQGVFGTGSAMQSLGAITSSVGKVTQALFPLAIAGYAAVAMFGRLTSAAMTWVKAADERTKNLLVLTTLLHGNKEAADELRNSLVSYAKATAFSVENTMELAIAMKALGFSANEIPTTLAKLGRLSFGDGGKLKLIAKAYSDVRAQGKLLMTEVRQFANQGVPLLAQLQLDLGKSALQVRDDMKAGLITFEQVETAINNIASAYGNVDEAGLATVGGQLEAAGEAWNEILAKTGDSKTLVEAAKALNQMLSGVDKLVGNTKVLDKTVKALGLSIRASLAFFTVGMSEIIMLTLYLKKLQSGEIEYNRKVKEFMDARKRAAEEVNRIKREELNIERQKTAVANILLKAQETSLDFLERKKKLQAEIDSNSANPAVKAKADKDLAAIEKEAELQKEIEESRKKIDQEADDTIAAAGGLNLSAKDKETIRARAEMRKKAEEDMIKAKHQAQAEQELRNKAMKDAEDLAKAEAEAAEKLQKQKEEWKKQDIEDAKKMIKASKEAQADFEKNQNEANKFKDMAPQVSPSFQANSVAEFTFRKEKELQRERQREENKREAARREHAEQLNDNLVRAIENLGLNANDQELGFEGIE
jgi:tape measure domain-containing protein